MFEIICRDCGDHPGLDHREVPLVASGRSSRNANGDEYQQELDDDEDHNGDDLGRRGVSPGDQVMRRRNAAGTRQADRRADQHREPEPELRLGQHQAAQLSLLLGGSSPLRG